MYHNILSDGYVLQNTQLHHAPALAELQTVIFPSLAPSQRMGITHYTAQIQLFPEGQFVVLDGKKPIAMSTTMRHNLTLEDHTFLEISGNMMLTTHQPQGDWLYGLDMGVLPQYRGKGLARALYQARQQTCYSLGLKGQVTVGMPNGYLNYAKEMDLDTYFKHLILGNLTDPTVSAQQKVGFKIVRLIHNYLDDPQCGNGGILMIYEAK